MFIQGMLASEGFEAENALEGSFTSMAPDVNLEVILASKGSQAQGALKGPLGSPQGTRPSPPVTTRHVL